MAEFDDTKPGILGTGDGTFTAPAPSFDDAAPGSLAPDGAPGVVPSAIVTGLRDVPLAGALFDKALTGAFGVDPELLEEMARTAGSTPVGKGLTFASSMVPEMLLGMGAFSLGRRALVAGLRASVPEAMAALAAPGAAGGRLATQLGGVAARGLDTAGGAPALQALGIRAGTLTKPAIERGAEILGGALGTGGLYGAGALAEGKDPGQALREGAFAAALTGGIESALTLGAKALFKGAREIPVGSLLAEAEARTAQLRGTQVGELQTKLNAINASITRNQGLGKSTGRLETRRAKVETDIKVMEYFHDMNPLFRQYLRGSPRDRASATQQLLLQFAKTPEALAGELGPSTAKMVELARMASMATTVARNVTNRELHEVGKLARVGLGSKTHRYGKPTPAFVDAVDTWQRTGSPVTATTADPASLTQAFDKLDAMMRKVEAELVSVGLVPPQPARTVGRMREWPVVLDRLAPANLLRPKGNTELTDAMAKAMVKLNGQTYEVARTLAHPVVHGKAEKIPGFRGDPSTRSVWSMFDDQSVAHLFPGRTFKEIVDAGAPIIKDPVVAVESYANSIARQVAYAKRLGPRSSMAWGPMRAMAAAEGADLQLYDQLLTAVTGASYGDVATQALASAITNTQTATRMGLGVVPNFAQFINIPLLTGANSLVKGLFSRFKQGPIKEAAEASALHDSMIRSWRESYLDPYTRTAFGRAADAVLNFTGFTKVERWNRMWAFHASANYAGKTLAKAVEGRLRGNALDIARRRFQGMGQNLDEMVMKARGANGNSTAAKVEDFLLGTHKVNPTTGLPERGMEPLIDIGMGGVRQTQFLPDKTRLPTFWNTPGGRVAFQFKSFALNQARLVRDQVINEAAKGNIAPLMYYAAAFPMAGEMVQNVRQLVKEGELKRQDSGLLRLVNDAAAVGAFGLASDLYRGAMWGPEQVFRAALGPTAEDAAYVLNAVVSRDFDRVVERANKLPTYRAALFFGSAGLGLGMEGAARLQPALQEWAAEDAAEEAAEVAPTLQQLQGMQSPR